MKKIIAGILAAASVLSVSVTAFATASDKNVSKAGELTYDVAVTNPKVVLDLVMPAKMAATLNPYGAEIVFNGTDTAKNGIISTSYKVTNKTKDNGVYIDATATTTVTTSDKDANGKAAWSVTGSSVTAGTKGACMALIANKTAPAPSSGKIAVPTATAAMTTSAAGALLMDSTAPADAEKKIPAGQTTQKKLGFAAAEGELYLTFVGELAGDDTTNKKEVEWKDDDAINVALILKVVAGPKTMA